MKERIPTVKEPDNITPPQPQAQVTQLPQPMEADQQKLQRLSVKFNARAIMDQEVGEALSEYINASNQVKTQLKAKITELEKKLEEIGKKPKPKADNVGVNPLEGKS